MKKGIAILFFWVLLFCSSIFANVNPSIFDELNYQELVEVDLSFDMESLFANRKNSNNYKAVFSYKNKKGTRRTWNIKVSQRGKFRRTKCKNLPPLKLNFKKGDLTKAGLSKIDDYKLVTHCVLDFEVAKTLLVKEYLAYKMYNQLTDESY